MPITETGHTDMTIAVPIIYFFPPYFSDKELLSCSKSKEE